MYGSRVLVCGGLDTWGSARLGQPHPHDLTGAVDVRSRPVPGPPFSARVQHRRRTLAASPEERRKEHAPPSRADVCRTLVLRVNQLKQTVRGVEPRGRA